MRRVIVFSKRKEICYDSMNSFLDRISRIMIGNGIEVVTFDAENVDGSEIFMCIKNSGEVDLAFSLNAGCELQIRYNGRNIWDMTGIPFYNLILDSPVEKNITMAIQLHDYHVICLDRNHVRFLEKYRPNIHAHFLPLAGTADIKRADSYEAFKNRKYDLMFAGTGYDMKKLEDEIMQFPTQIRKLVISHIDYMLSHRGDTVEQGLRVVLRDMGVSDSDHDIFLKCLQVTAVTTIFLRGLYREEVIKSLLKSGIHFHIFGNGWDGLLRRYPGCNVAIHGPVQFVQSIELFRETKLSLNVMPLFKDGMHDRIPTSMLNGAAVLTDHSAYLDENLKDYLNFYDIETPECVGEIAMVLLDDLEGIYDRVEKAWIYAWDHMSWECYAAKLMKIMKIEQ